MENEIPDFIRERDVFGLEKSIINYEDFDSQEEVSIINDDVIYASLGIRIAAYLLDAVILFIPITISQILLVFIVRTNDQYDILSKVMNLLIWTLYYGITESSKLQATIGKLICGIKVIDEQGNKISFAKAVFRHLAIILSVLPLGFGIWAIAREGKKQAWHDMLLGCYVIKKRKSKKSILQTDTAKDQVLTNKLTCELLHSEIVIAKKNVFGNFNDKIVEILEEISKDEAQLLIFLEDYKILYKKDLIKTICELSSSYDTIKQYLAPLIDKNIIENKYPHNKIIKN